MVKVTPTSCRTALVAVLIALAVPAFGSQPASFAIRVEPTEVRRGEVLHLWVDVSLAEGWHTYSATTPPGGPFPTALEIEHGGPFLQTDSIIQPQPQKEHDPNFGISVETFSNTVSFGRRAEVLQNATPGEYTLAGRITYMLCDATTCLPPTTETLETSIRVVLGPPRPQYAGNLGSPEVPATRGTEAFDGLGSVVDVNRARNRGIGAFLYLAFAMGFLALLTPCVFPMVPITVSFFTKAESQTRTQSVVKSLVYCGGIIATFTGLGLLLAATLGAAGAALFAANPWVNIAITLLFLAFALNLFGLFEIRLPSGMLSRLSGTSGGGYGAILLMGFTFTLTSFTCTAPFVGTLLVLTSQGTWSWPVLGMLAFSAAFALPFFFLSLFPQGLGSLPRSGGWLNSVKVAMGFLELAAAMKFLSNADLVWEWGVISREVFIASWIAVFIMCAVYLLGKIRLPHDTPLESVGPVRLILSIAFLAFGLFLFTGLSGAPLGELDAFFPPYSTRGETAGIKGGEELSWHTNFEEASEASQTSGNPMFVDFTGYACTNCRWMEANLFPEPEIRQLLERYVRLRLYTDGTGDVHAQNRDLQQSRFGTVALPFYAVLSPTDQVLATFPGMTRDGDLFLSFLRSGLAPGSATARSQGRGETR